ncbi:MAG TPA: DNA polymerase/3'-5' exonuclease PolX [Candidatus Thermoplasmatota archaeon]|nr:DNA polymerase/3'-5' exonuclease PolX [Candidatus Thermoplasmatota archaeon]
MKNKFVADTLYLIADLLDLKGEVFFKTRAYRMAAQTIEAMEEDIETFVRQGTLESIPGVGEALAKKITELLTTGKLKYLEDLKKEVPTGLVDLLSIPGLGPKKVAAIYSKLGITTLKELQEAAAAGKLRGLFGFGETTEKNILRGIQLLEKTSGRVLLNRAYMDGMEYVAYLKSCTQIQHIDVAGSLRRMKETIGDLDILISSKDPEPVMDYFVAYPMVERVLAKGSTKSTVLLKDNLQVDLRVVEEKSYGAGLQYFTGSKDHNVTLRGFAIKKGFKLNEYGLFDKDTDRFIAGKTEVEIYKKIGFPYIEPELRENRGEFEAARNGELPKLVGYDDIQGDLHVHSDWSDGKDSLEAIVQAAKKRNYRFIGIADHSQSLTVANGLSEARVAKKLAEIEKLRKQHPKITILAGTECDIKQDGTLDYNNKTLKRFDYVIIGIHTAFKMEKSAMTKRITSAMENEHVNILAHPTGRLLGKRDAYEVDVDELIDAAKRTETRLEINAVPERLDLDDVHARQAKDQGIQLTIGTDSHNIQHFDFMRFGIATARRGWLEKKDILNTLPPKDVLKALEASR